MFDWVEFSTKCPNCGSNVQGFQSKSGDCLLETLSISDVDNFYSSCEGCGLWIEFTKQETRKSVPFTRKTRLGDTEEFSTSRS